MADTTLQLLVMLAAIGQADADATVVTQKANMRSDVQDSCMLLLDCCLLPLEGLLLCAVLLVLIFSAALCHKFFVQTDC